MGISIRPFPSGGMSASMKGQALQTPQYLQRVAQQLATTQKARHSASKYDFVKVTVSCSTSVSEPFL